MSSVEHTLRAQTLASFETFEKGLFAASAAAFASDAVFVVPGRSSIAGTYRGRDGIATFFERLSSVPDGTLKVEPLEVLSNDRHMVLFFRVSGQRDGAALDVVAAGFHSDRGPDGWRRATFLPDNQAAFDRFYAKP